eukprot:SAG31_NODE_481_length_15082_cov_13.818728_5_plen_107_part_00
MVLDLNSAVKTPLSDDRLCLQRDTVKVGGDALASLQTNAARQDKHDAKMHDMFEQRLREMSENPNNIMTAMVCQRFEEEMLQQHQQAQDGAMSALTATVGTSVATL